MIWFLVGDTHFTDNQRDAYRFGIFDWIAKQQQKKTVAATFFAGDICDAKDRHSASLVNKVVAGFLKLKPPVYICLGNHDYRDPRNPFFGFLNHIEGLYLLTVPTSVVAVARMAVIPHVRTQAEFDASVAQCAGADAFLVHQTFEGAIAETGARLTGLSASPIELLKPRLGVYAGDVHRPQRSGIVTYIGCPYAVRFGDDYDVSCIFVNKNGNQCYPWFEAPKKWTLRVRDGENIRGNEQLVEGDQVKLTIELTREEAVEWKQIKASILTACKARGLEVHGVKLEVSTPQKKRVLLKTASNPAKIVEQYCTAENAGSQVRKIGLQLIGNKHGN